MAKMKYVAKLFIHSFGSADIPAEDITVPAISSFSVDGGANREVNLSSTDEISISSEFEQARTHKNINFFIPPSNDFLAVKLVQLRQPGGGWIHFSMTFVVDIYTGKTKTQILRLESSDAWFLSFPAPTATTPPLLTARTRFHQAELLHGRYEKKNKEMVYEEV